MPWRARVAGAAWRVPPSAGASCGPSACSTVESCGPAVGDSPPAARCPATSAPLASADDCGPPVRSPDSFEVPSVPGVSSAGAAGLPSVVLRSPGSLMLCLQAPSVRPLRGTRSRSCVDLAQLVRRAELVLALLALPLRRELDRGRHQLGLVPAGGELGGPPRAERLVHDLRVDL